MLKYTCEPEDITDFSVCLAFRTAKRQQTFSPIQILIDCHSATETVAIAAIERCRIAGFLTLITGDRGELTEKGLALLANPTEV